MWDIGFTGTVCLQGESKEKLYFKGEPQRSAPDVLGPTGMVNQVGEQGAQKASMDAVKRPSQEGINVDA